MHRRKKSRIETCLALADAFLGEIVKVIVAAMVVDSFAPRRPLGPAAVPQGDRATPLRYRVKGAPEDAERELLLLSVSCCCPWGATGLLQRLSGTPTQGPSCLQYPASAASRCSCSCILPHTI